MSRCPSEPLSKCDYSSSPHRADIALIGLAVMGQNIIMNMNDHGFVVRSCFCFFFPLQLLSVNLFHCNLLFHPVITKPIQQVCAYNRTVSKVKDFLQNEAKGSKVVGAESLEDMVSKLKKPRRIILLVKAGQAVDDFIDKLVGSVCRAVLKSLVKNESYLLNHPALFFFRFLFLRPGISSSTVATPNTEIQQ